MIQLSKYVAVMFFYCINNRSETRNKAIVVNAQRVIVWTCRLGDDHRLGHDHGDTAPRPLLVIHLVALC